MGHPINSTTFKVGDKDIEAAVLGRKVNIDGISIVDHYHRLPDGRRLWLTKGEMVPELDSDGMLKVHSDDPDDPCTFLWWEIYSAWDDLVVVP